MEGDPGDQRPGLRVGDEDRAGVVELLRAHTADGRLTLDEFSERVGVALAAQTRADLEKVTADLPAPSAAAGAPAPETRRRKASRWVVAFMSGNGRRGRWRTGSHVTALAVMGGCDLDFRQAEFESDEIVVTAVSIMGGISIVVPEGIAVELTGFPILGGKNLKVADVPVLPGSPRIVVRAFPVMGGVDIRSKPTRTRRETLRDTASSILREMAAADQPAAVLPKAAADLQEGILRQVNEKVARELARAERRNERQVRRADRLVEAVMPGVAGYGRRWGMQLEGDEEAKLPDDAELSSVPAAPDGTVTIMFTDICGYSELTERLGDRRAHELVNEYQKIVRGQLASYGGYEVKVQGDGFMVAFAGASRALRCAMAIQRAMDDYSKDHVEEPLRVHQGLHTGEAVRENGDFLGRTVILASRIADDAAESEILVSSLLKELADATKEFRFGPPRQAVLKGVSPEQVLYPVQWRA